MLRLNGCSAQEHPVCGGCMKFAAFICQYGGDPAIQGLMRQMEMTEADDIQLSLNVAGKQDIYGIDGLADDDPPLILLIQGLSVGGSVGVQIQMRLAYAAAGFQLQCSGQRLRFVGAVGIHIKVVGLQISVEFRGSRVRDKRITQTGDVVQQVVGVELGRGNRGRMGIAEIFVNQFRQGNSENITNMDDQAQGNALSALQHGTEVSLLQRKAPFLQQFTKLDLAELMASHQRVQLSADGVFIFCVQIAGGSGDGAFFHDHDLLTVITLF